MKNYTEIHPWTLTGLIDAEGSLGVNVSQDITGKSGYNITLSLEIALNFKDKLILDNIK